MAFTLICPAFPWSKKIPRTYTQFGENLSPPITWSGVPKGTRSLVLVVEDPDAPVGTVTHWAAFDIDPRSTGLSEGAANCRQGTNDMGNARYDGPKPPRGDGPHRYHFRLSALDIDVLGLAGEPTSREIKKAARGHFIAETELVGSFEAK